MKEVEAQLSPEQARQALGMETITALAERSMVSARPRSSIGADRGPSFETVELATLEWVDWFNNSRVLEPIGNIPSAEAEERYDALWKPQPWQHDSNELASGRSGAVHMVLGSQ